MTTYDSQGRTASIETPEGKVSYTYDKYGRQTSVQADADPPTFYTYDRFGRLATVSSDNETTRYEYDAFGNLAETRLPNGIVTTYEYDNLNRLTVLTNYVDKNNNGVFDTGEGISRFEYELDGLGRKDFAVEKFWTEHGEKTNEIDWEYDAAGRLTYEKFDHYDDRYDQTSEWLYDLVGNRLKQTVNGIDTLYDYDVNDRLLWEETGSKRTEYGYTGTQQTSKVVTDNLVEVSRTEFEYDAQGRMSVVTITTSEGVEKTTYEYDANGIRVSAIHEKDGVVTKTEYLNDPLSLTGYSQVLKQTETVDGEVTKTISYVIGHQRISQIVIENGTEQEYYFTFDGHGSTRALLDFIAAVVHLYSFDAYGNALGFDPVTALTEFLYSGEQFDAKIGQQYLRARYYDPATGRFNRLDPFFGNQADPQSFHKYLYTHADPVNLIDPSGEWGITLSLAFGLAIGGTVVGAGIGAGIAWFNNGQWDGSWTNIGNSALKGAGIGFFALPSAAFFLSLPWPAMVGLGMLLVPTAEYVYNGMARSPSSEELKKIEAAEKIIKSSVVFYNYYGSFYGILPEDGPWGLAPKYQWHTFNKTIYLNKNALELPDKLLATLIVHEATHNRQFFPFKAGPMAEAYAYYCQSMFSKHIGISGTISQISSMFPGNNHVGSFLKDQADYFNIYQIQYPAVIH